MDFEALARAYGYPAVLLGTALQGEAILLVGGFLAHQGYLSVWLVWAVAALGGSTGDLTYFALGRIYGERVIARLPRGLRNSLEAARRLVERHPRKVLMYMRFLFGMRILLPIMTGASSIAGGRFVRYNLITAFIWAGIFVALGWGFGEAAQRVFKRFEGLEWILIVVLVSLGLLYHLVGRRLHHRWHRDDDA